MPVRLAPLLALCATLCACAGAVGQRRGVPADYGELLVYLQPFSPEADRLRFRLEEAWAEREDGTLEPLSLALRDLDLAAAGRQRLLIADALPPGGYRALLLRVGKATLRTEEGDTPLLVPEAPTRVEQAFAVTRDRPALLFLSFQYRESVEQGYRFEPRFSRFVPSRPTTALLGYAASPDWPHLTVFDKRRAQVVDVIGTGRGPRSIALDPAARRAYVAASADDAVEVIDTGTGERIQRIPLRVGDSPWELYLTRERRTLLVLNQASDTVSFIDVATTSEAARVRVGHGPSSVTLDRTERKAVVFNTLASTVSVLDLPNRSVVATVPVEPGPTLGQFNRRGDRLYVAHESSPYLLLVDFQSLQVVKRVLVGMGVSGLKVDPGSDLLYLSRRGQANVEVYDPFSLLATDFLKAGGGASRLAIDGEENSLLLAQPAAGRVSLVNLNVKKVSGELDVAGEPSWVTVVGER